MAGAGSIRLEEAGTLTSPPMTAQKQPSERSGGGREDVSSASSLLVRAGHSRSASIPPSPQWPGAWGAERVQGVGKGDISVSRSLQSVKGAVVG